MGQDRVRRRFGGLRVAVGAVAAIPHRELAPAAARVGGVRNTRITTLCLGPIRSGRWPCRPGPEHRECRTRTAGLEAMPDAVVRENGPSRCTGSRLPWPLGQSGGILQYFVDQASGQVVVSALPIDFTCSRAASRTSSKDLPWPGLISRKCSTW